MSDDPILIICTKCSSRVEKTYESLHANADLHCPVCGHNMADERAAVLAHVDRIRETIAASWPERRS